MTEAAERVGSLVFLAVTTVYLIVATRLPTESPNLSDMGPRVYPLILGVAAVTLSALWVVQTFRPRSTRTAVDGASSSDGAEMAGVGDSAGTSEQAEPAGHSRLKALVLIGAAALFPILLQRLTFVATAAIVLFALSTGIAWRRPTPRQVIVTAVFAVVCAFALRFLLSDVMAIYLP